MSKIFFLSKNWHRHGNFSGYEKILNYVSIDLSLISSFRIPFVISKFLKKKTCIKNYSAISLSKELKILFNFPKNKIIHILYGDMDYFYLHILKKRLYKIRKNTLVATFHHPESELEKRINYNRQKVLGALDKIIVMGTNQIPFFKKYTKAEIKFIPHGIDSNYFKPLKDKSSRKNEILIIGVSHRNHQRNIEIIKAVSNFNIKIVFTVIMVDQYAKLYKNLPNVIIRIDNISDKELLKYYQTSKGVLLSLVDCTASNTILEALSTGCPLITNNVGAVKDYIPMKSGIRIFETSEIKESAEFIKQLIINDNLCIDINNKQRILAMEYDWHNIAKITEEFILSK